MSKYKYECPNTNACLNTISKYNGINFPSMSKYKYKCLNTNRLLTEREGRTGKYWPEGGQYFPVRPEQARLVSCLLYGTLFLIVKCTSGGFRVTYS